MTSPPDTSSAYKELVAAIVKAIKSRNDPDHYIAQDGKIWLDDILVTLRLNRQINAPEVSVDMGGMFWVRIDNRVWQRQEFFHLGHDLAWHRDHAPETIEFLHSLICK